VIPAPVASIAILAPKKVSSNNTVSININDDTTIDIIPKTPIAFFPVFLVKDIISAKKKKNIAITMRAKETIASVLKI
jgi:hypothetical protein